MAQQLGKSKQLAIVAPPDTSRESTIKALSSYNKERLLGTLSQIRTAGPGYAEALNVSPQVSRLVGNEDPEVVTAAVSCLGLMGHRAQAYEQQIRDCAAYPVTAVRAAAVEAMGHLAAFLKYPEAVAGSAVDSDATVRVKVCQAIAEMEGTMMHETVSRLLEDPSAEVRCAAIEALAMLVAISQELQSVYKDKMGGLLSGLLEDGRTKIAALDAIAALGELAPSTCTSAAVSALGNKDIFTRQSAVAAVGALSDSASKEGITKIRDFLKSEDAGVRAAAANALAMMGDKASGCAEAVAQLLSDPAEDASGMAFVMGNGGRRPLPQMRRPKCAAVTALSRLSSSSQHVGKISEALNDKHWEVRLSAAESLASLKGKATSEVSALLGSMEDDAFPVRAMACFALGQIGDREAIPRLVEAFEDSAYSVRLYALQAVAEMGQAAEEFCHDVFKLTDDSVPSVRAAAVKALAKLGSTGANYASVVATMLSNQEDPEIRVAACEALADMGEQGNACAEEVEELLYDHVPPVRQAAVAALEAMGYRQSPFLKDFGRGPGVPFSKKPEVLLPGEVSFEGLGLYYNDILQTKQELVSTGKWIEGVL